MFGIGMPELILILAIALIVIGPKKLPDLAKSLGRAMREFKKATNEFKETLQIDEDLTDVKKAFDGLNKDIKDSASPKESAEFKRPDASQAPEDKPEEKTEEGEKDAQGDEPNDKIENVKTAFDELKNNEKAGEKKQPQEGSGSDA
jgi:sec-independent protein translocase protein TatB